jgi:hypothetical protein
MRITSLLLASLSFILAAHLAFAEDKEKPSPADQGPKWIVLFDGKSLDGWKSTMYGGEGEVKVENGEMIVEQGAPLSGVTFQDAKKLLKTNYEISLEAKRLTGSDFFCGLTFPVREKEHCSFICGGWGGALTGISSIDGYDASENSTTNVKEFKNDKWYKIRVKVTDDRLKCWIDDEQLVDVDIKDKKLTTRGEVDLSQPFGLCSFEVKAAYRDVKIRPIK